MRFSSDVCAELQDSTINGLECAKCEGVSHLLFFNNMADLYLKRGIPPSTVYCNQACMVSMDQGIPMKPIPVLFDIKSNITDLEHDQTQRYFLLRYALIIF